MSEEIKETRQEGILFTIDCLKHHKFNFDYCLDELIEETTNLQSQLQQKENILKEVREKINNYTTRMEVLNYQISDLTKKELLEILDKEVN